MQFCDSELDRITQFLSFEVLFKRCHGHFVPDVLELNLPEEPKLENPERLASAPLSGLGCHAHQLQQHSHRLQINAGAQRNAIALKLLAHGKKWGG